MIKFSANSSLPLVSAVIPTRNRPELVVRAVRSALAQTYPNLEVVVIIDGPDRGTVEALSDIYDDRLRFFELSDSVGGAQARNEGVRRSRGAWIGFLDDDDMWMPDKIAKQIRLAHSNLNESEFVVVGCRIIRRENVETIWGTEAVEKFDNVREYILRRNHLTSAAQQIQTSTLLFSRSALEKYQFRALRRHQEWDLLFRMSLEDDFEFLMHKDPLSVWVNDENITRISNNINPESYKISLNWIMEYKNVISDRAYGDFLLTVASSIARDSGNIKGMLEVIRQSFRFGKPGFMAIAVWINLLISPKNLRARIRSNITR